MTTSTQTKNLYWCSDEKYSGHTSLFFEYDPEANSIIKETAGLGYYQYETDGNVWYVNNNKRESVFKVLKLNGYRIVEIGKQQAGTRRKLKNQRRQSSSTWQSQRDKYQEEINNFRENQQEQRRRYREKTEREREEKRQQEKRDREKAERERQERRQRETGNAFNDFFNNHFNSNNGQSRTSFKELEDSWLSIFYSLDNELAKKVYRQVAMALHPDRQGDEEAMKVLNTAWDLYQNPNKRRR